MIMKILVTGSNGFFGRMFIEFLNHKGISYAVYDRAHPQDIPLDVTAVVHFAGLTPHSLIRGRVPTERKYREANVESTKILLDALSVLGGLDRFVHIGSASEYGFSRGIFTEKSGSRPEDVYGASKLTQSALVEDFSRTRNVKTFNLRVFNVTGISHHPNPEGFSSTRPHLFAFLMSEFRKKLPLLISVNNTKDVRDFVAPEDVLEAIYLALLSDKGGVYELVNICSGKGTSVAGVVSLFGRVLGVPYTLKSRTKTVRQSVGSPKKAKRLLGWESKTTLAECVRRYIGDRSRILIVGAGVGGKMLLDEMDRENRTDVVIVGFVDDDPKKRKQVLKDIPVLGVLADIPRIVKEQHIDHVLISTPSVGVDVVLRVTNMLPPGFPIKILPSVSSVILGKVDLSYVREIDPSDLIGRPLVKSNQELIAKNARGKRFLVTGGAGSIGSEIVRQLVDSGAKQVVVFDSWEEGIFNILEEMNMRDGVSQVIGRIGNIRDKERLEEVFSEFSFDAVLHAAAYKHVPLMEESPTEAKKTNVYGTKNVLEAVCAHSVSNFVLISTDKAVRPSSVMGKTKRQAELLVKEYALKYRQRSFSAVRFGNVLNSSGSAVPKFLKQIRSRQAVTITDKQMTRYFMSIPEAVSLVLTSWVVAKNGQILLLDMGQPVRILDLAEKLIKLHGLKPYVDIPIVETGVRPGEKIHEELTYDHALLKPTSAPRIFIAEEL